MKMIQKIADRLADRGSSIDRWSMMQASRSGFGAITTIILTNLLATALVLALAAVMAMADAPIGLTVGATNKVILPSRINWSQVPWTASTTLKQGKVVQVPTGTTARYYMAETNLVTGSTAPTHVYGVISGLRFVPSDTRAFFILQNLSTNRVYINFDSAAVSGKGFAVDAGAGIAFSDYQNEIHAIATRDSTILILESTTIRK